MGWNTALGAVGCIRKRMLEESYDSVQAVVGKFGEGAKEAGGTFCQKVEQSCDWASQ